ncbi:MAG: beta-lactamase family protein [Planctomycetes bacterium]|nr:beta-lactamase family protein [Planctomycetota bacterium]
MARPLRALLPSLLVLTPVLAPLPAQIAPLEQRIRAHLEAARQQRGFPGVSVACMLPDGEAVAVAVGVDGDGVPLTTKSRLMSGSIGKTYCAAIVLQLAGAGDLELDGQVEALLGANEWYGRVPNAGSITIRQLLNHTSGIPEHVWQNAFQRAVAEDPDRALTPVECLEFALDERPLFAAGERFSYADTNYLLLGLCVEHVTGQPFGEVLRARLLEPLALKDTIWNDRRELPGLCCGLASGVAFTKGKTVVDGRYFTNPSFEYCGGGVSSTPADLARWFAALFGGDVVPEPLRAEQRHGVVAPRHVSGAYGLGCFVGESEHGPALGHSGIMPGFLSYALYYPKLEIAVAVQFPTDAGREVGNLRRLVDELAELAVAPADK